MTSVFPCVARGFKAWASACRRAIRALAVGDRAETSIVGLVLTATRLSSSPRSG